MHSQRNFVLNIGFGRSPTSIFEVGFEKSDSKKLRVGTNLPCLLRLQMQKFPEQKNNRPLQVELENGRSQLQNDFQIWKAR